MIRLLNATDYDQYYPLINEFRSTVFSEKQFVDYMTNLPSNIEIWALEKDNQIVGTSTVIYEPKLIHNMCTYAHIEDVCISGKYRGQGLGSIMLKKIFKVIKKRDCLKVTLVCDEKTSQFYIKNSLEKRGVQCCQLLKHL